MNTQFYPEREDDEPESAWPFRTNWLAIAGYLLGAAIVIAPWAVFLYRIN